MSEHTWFQENLAGYLASGLSTEESERFERHRIACSACAQTLADFKGWDCAMDELFTPVRPPATLEDTMIKRLRGVSWWRSKNASLVRRIGAGVAALIALGTMGAFLQAFVGEGRLPFPGVTTFASAKASNNLKQSEVGLLEGFSRKPVATSEDATERESAGLILRDKEEAVNTFSDISNKAADGRRSKLSKHSEENLRAENGVVVDNETRSSGTALEFSPALGAVDDSWKSHTSLADGILGRKARRGEVSHGNNDTPPTFSSNTYSVPGLGFDAPADRLAEKAQVQVNAPDNYFSPSLSVTKSDQTKPGPTEPSSQSIFGRQMGEDKAAANKLNRSQEKGQPEMPPLNVGRKIIRTGDIEFEVDGFDAAVANITRVVNSIAGAFVATVNSDKLPNGKVKGSLVVRLPPDKLDKFLLDVRHDLAKTGELKSQRIGSQDVTKQYTDLESRLRGARTMEERFLQIIKTGKGEIKDLIVAENALGVWRTKIEEMEGEIRYYNNQVGLSTLTITLVEKEIQAPAALVVTQRIKLQLEVDDVDKAQQAALAAVAEAKGRVTKSELKQHAAGQLEAILHFEVAPSASDKVRDQLKQLGVVTHQDADRIQQTEGNGLQTPDIKIKQTNVKFEVGIYNTANVQPRDVQVLQIASLNVSGGFHKLQEAVAKVKGQVRTGQLNEQDKLNITAQFDFDVPRTAMTEIDQAVAEVGKVVSRTSSQAAPGAAATDRKIGYRLVLRNVAALPSRERISLGIEVKDVDQTAADILDTVKNRQGSVAGAQVNHERDGRVSAVLVFDVPLSAKDELIRQLKSAGVLRVQTATRNPQVAENELATAHIDVTLTSAGSIVPEEGFWPQIRTSLVYSFKLLSWSLMFIILGFSVVLPWVLLIWVAVTLFRRWRKRPAAGSV